MDEGRKYQGAVKMTAKNWEVTDRGRLLLFFYAARKAGVTVAESLVDSMVYLLKEVLPFGYSFFLRTFPQSPELHEDLGLLVSMGRLQHDSPYRITLEGIRLVDKALSSKPGFSESVAAIVERVREFQGWDRAQYHRAIYSRLGDE